LANSRHGISTDAATFNALLRQALRPRQAAASGKVPLQGRDGDLEKFFEMFNLSRLMEPAAISTAASPPDQKA